MKSSVIRPGILVALKTTLTGGVSYSRRDLDTGKTLDELRAEAAITGAPVPAVSRWETTRTIDDPAEHAAAVSARGKAGSLIRGACLVTSFGLLCPTENESQLDAAMAEARAIVASHNGAAVGTRIGVYVLKGRIAGTDEEAARSIVREVSELIAEMNAGIAALDPKAIRDAATRAAEMSNMLAPEQAEIAANAVVGARAAARLITKRVKDGAEDGAIILADVQRGALEKARIAFLDLEESAAVAGPSMPAANVQRFDSLDVESAPHLPTADDASDDDAPASEPRVEQAPTSETTIAAPSSGQASFALEF